VLRDRWGLGAELAQGAGQSALIFGVARGPGGNATFCIKLVERLGKGSHEISPGAVKMLSDYPWEGNIDELEAALESAISATQPQQIDESLLPSRIRYAALKSIPSSGIELPRMVDDFERGLIDTALRQTNNNQTKAAALLGLRVQTLNMKLKRFKEKDDEDEVVTE